MSPAAGWRGLLLGVLGLVAVLWGMPAGAQGYELPEIVPFSQVKPGMKGEGRTVFRGTKVEAFTLEVIDVMQGMGPSGGNLILFRGTSQNLKDHHGVSQGMSGSPIYLDGKLAGAVSLAFPAGDPMVGGITPIEEMFEALSDSLNAKPVSTSYLVPGYGEARVASAPVFAAGASQRAARDLAASLSRDNGPVEVLTAAPLGRAEEEVQVLDEPPQPGSTVIVGLLQGDVSVFSAGTVTAVVGDKVIAFGHSFRRVGEVDLIMGRGYVTHVMKHRDVPYKLVRPVGIYGRMDEDRGVAMIGTLLRFPGFTRIKVSALDASRGESHTAHYRAVTDEKVSLEVTRTALLSTIDKALDRIGRGTSRVSFSVQLEGQDEPIERANTFYNPADIAAESIRELDMLLRFFVHNEFKEVKVASVTFSAEVLEEDQAMMVKKVALKGAQQKEVGVARKKDTGGAITITFKKTFNGPPAATVEEEDEEGPMPTPEDAGDRAGEKGGKGKGKAPRPGEDPDITVAPGEPVDVEVTLLPYRKEPVTRKFHIAIDEKVFPPGEYNFTVGGYEPPGEGDAPPEEEPITFDEAMEEFYELNRNDELILECQGILPSEPPKDDDEEPDREALRQVLAVPGYAIGGQRSFRVTVKAPGKDGKPKVKKAPPRVQDDEAEEEEEE